MMPPKNSLTMETPPMTPKMIIGMLGGIIGPMQPEAEISAVLFGVSYPSFFIIGSRIEPMAEVSATAEPDTPANSMLAITAT